MIEPFPTRWKFPVTIKMESVVEKWGVEVMLAGLLCLCLVAAWVVLGDDPLDQYQYGEPTPWHSKYNLRGGTGI